MASTNEFLNQAISVMDVISVVASIVSLVIGGFAIWLSVTFYRLSNKVSEETKEAAKGISASVERLETLFDRLYSDTFSMMKDTVTDMRKHIWADNGKESDIIELIDKNSKQKIEELKKETSAELAQALSKVGEREGNIQLMQQEIQRLLEKVIKQTRLMEIEAQQEYSLADVLNTIIEHLSEREFTTLERLRLHPAFRRRFPVQALKEGLAFLEKEGIIESHGPAGHPRTKYTMVRKSRESNEVKEI